MLSRWVTHWFNPLQGNESIWYFSQLATNNVLPAGVLIDKAKMSVWCLENIVWRSAEHTQSKEAKFTNGTSVDLFISSSNIKPFHFCWQQGQNLGAGQYELKSFLDDWGSEHKKKHGKFGKVAQYPEKNSDRIYCCTLSQLKRDVVSVIRWSGKSFNLVCLWSMFKWFQWSFSLDV